MTEAIMNPQDNRKRMAEIKFEKFKVARLQVGIQALLPLFAEVPALTLSISRVWKPPFSLIVVMVSHIASRWSQAFA